MTTNPTPANASSEAQDDFQIIRIGLDALCEQLPNGAILNPAVRIMSALKRLEANQPPRSAPQEACGCSGKWFGNKYHGTVCAMHMTAMGCTKPETTPQEAMQWRPIESAPRDGTEILVWVGHNPLNGHKPEWSHMAHARWTKHNNGGWVWEGLCGLITHWMPLPEAPHVEE